MMPVDPLDRVRLIVEITLKNFSWLGPLSSGEVEWLIARVEKKDYEPGKAKEDYKP